MNMFEGEWGLSATIVALILIALIFGTAYRFIRKAGGENRRIRRRQVHARPSRHERHDYVPPKRQ